MPVPFEFFQPSPISLFHSFFLVLVFVVLVLVLVRILIFWFSDHAND